MQSVLLFIDKCGRGTHNSSLQTANSVYVILTEKDLLKSSGYHKCMSSFFSICGIKLKVKETYLLSET